MSGERLSIGMLTVNVGSRNPRNWPCRKVKVPGVKEPIRIPKVSPLQTNAAGLFKNSQMSTRLQDDLYVVRLKMWGRPPPEDEWARHYEDRCLELNRSPAGKRARDLLFRHLSEDQLKQVERYNYFDVVRFHPWNHWIYDHHFLDSGQGWGLPHLLFRIHRGTALANVDLFFINGQEDDRYPEPDYLLCIQTREPLPTDDIALGQKLMIEHQPNYFVRTAIPHTPPPYIQPLPLKITSIFKPPWLHPDWPVKPLELPYLRDLARDHSWSRHTRREQVLAYIGKALDYTA